jgi:hypothetical protein
MDASRSIRWHRIVAALGAMVLLVEIFAQAYTWVWAGRPYRSLAKYRFSPYGLVRNNPDLTMAGYTVSADGFRNPRSYPRQKPPHTLRVLLVGGSVLYAGLAGTPVRGAERLDSDRTIARYLEEALRADPELAGLDVEVINAGVNFNRLLEVVTGFLGAYLAYQPDVVIVFGTANNFPNRMHEGEYATRAYGTSGVHPWAREFERVTNRRDFWSFVEHGELFLEDGLASVAWARKVSEKALDRAFGWVERHRLGRRAAPPRPYAGAEEIDGYFREYGAMADALVTAARGIGADVAFFWEYYLEIMDGLKPLSSREAELRARFARPSWREEKEFSLEMRDRLRAFLAARRVPLVDPLPALEHDGETVFADYVHYTAHGNELAGRFIYQELRDTFRRRAAALR